MKKNKWIAIKFVLFILSVSGLIWLYCIPEWNYLHLGESFVCIAVFDMADQSSFKRQIKQLWQRR